MKKPVLLSLFLAALSFMGTAQKSSKVTAAENTLLWKISGKSLSKPSYLFGTMHLLCGDDIVLSDSLKTAIRGASRVYLELEMDNLFEMMGAMQNMQMKGDTTLADLLTAEEYKKVKAYFEDGSSMFPFQMLQSFKPLLATTMIAQQESKAAACDNMIAMEALIMSEAKQNNIKVKGLETMNFQLGLFDQIPYKMQAKQLYEAIIQIKDSTATNDMVQLTNAYRNQKLEMLEALMKKEDAGMKNFTELLLYKRNENWATKLAEMMPDGSLVVAVGAGHLPGSRGVINLLRKAGYKVEPVRNDMIVKKVKEI